MAAFEQRFHTKERLLQGSFYFSEWFPDLSHRLLCWGVLFLLRTAWDTLSSTCYVGPAGVHAKIVSRLTTGDLLTWKSSGKALSPLWQHSKRTMTCICHLARGRKACFILCEAIVLVLHIYKDGESCGLGSLWQEICKFIAHGEKGFGGGLGVSHYPQHSWGKKRRTWTKASSTLRYLLHTGRKVEGSCMCFQKEALALLFWPKMHWRAAR